MSLKNKIKGISKLKRYSLVWDWIEEHQLGEYVKYDDVVLLFTNEIDKREEGLTEEQWKAFVKKLENVEYDEELAKFYSERKHKFKISKELKI